MCSYYLFYLRQAYQFKFTSDVVAPWLLGFILVLFASWQTWDLQRVNWMMSGVLMSAAFVLVWASLKKSEKIKVMTKMGLVKKDYL